MGTNEAINNDAGNRDALKTDTVATIFNVDLDQLVGQLLKTAARSVNSEEASILVRDGEAGELSFLKAIGQVGDQLEGIVIPAGKGVASFVVSSGQPMAISDVGRESSFYDEIDKKTGFSTEILLATPLIVSDEIIGVLEFVNRAGDPPYAPFTPEEMDRAAIHAEGIAALVSVLMASRLSDAFAAEIGEEAGTKSIGSQREWIAAQKGNREQKVMLDLAVLVKEVAGLGESQRQLCRELLESMLRFSTDEEGSDLTNV